MTETVLVTGGAEPLGATVTEQLRAVGPDHRGLNRMPADARVSVDLATGHGVDAAANGTSAVVVPKNGGNRMIPPAYYRHTPGIERLVAATRPRELTAPTPAGRAPNPSGPDVDAAGDLTLVGSRARARRDLVVPALATALRRSEHARPEQARGVVTSDEFLSAHTPRTGA